MTSTELRIGNFVYTDRMIYNELVVVNTISYNPDKKDYLLSISHFPYLTISQCKPIPLTEEWLVKFGFQYDRICSIWRAGFFCIEESTNGYVNTINGGEYTNGVDCKYVHQLQNLHFALTGEELVCK